MFDTCRYLQTFYEEHVRLGAPLRGELAKHRDACLELLKSGLRKLGERRRRPDGYPEYVRTVNQGSYAMNTLNQHPHKEYDIDVAVIFRREDLPEHALKARQRVAEALRASLNNFATKPLARTNAVTVWYTKGEHVDLAVYREVVGDGEPDFLEHASAQWRRRDPEAVNEWFSQNTQRLSPTPESGATVEKLQFRRIVRLVKAFARSRVSWELPGGMILSTLVAEVYQPDPHRDDVSLYNTLCALQSRLRENLEVDSPVAQGESLTSKRQIRAQVERLLGKLNFVLPHLEVLKAPDCLEERALTAWSWVFRHRYWYEQSRNARLRAALAEPTSLRVRAGLAGSERGPIRSAYKDRAAISKDTWLCFSLKKRLDIPLPVVVRWLVQSRGQEALSAGEGEYKYVGEGRELWLRAKYKGRHSITCEVIKDGYVVARGIRHMLVSSD